MWKFIPMIDLLCPRLIMMADFLMMEMELQPDYRYITNFDSLTSRNVCCLIGGITKYN